MQSIVTSFPLELLSIDFLTIEVKGKKQDILVMMDHFTKFGHAVMTPNQTAHTVARVLWQNFFLIYGFPTRILSDQGRDFESKIVAELCKIAGIRKCRTTPYHPAGNPVERWNRTLINMLRSLEDGQKDNWRKMLPAVVHAYNCCVHQSTGFSPYMLFFGRQPRLPIDIAFGLDVNHTDRKPTVKYVQDLKTQLSEAYQKASENMAKSHQKNKTRYDRSAHAAELEPGDRVLVRKLGPRLDSKISDRWENKIYIVIEKSEGLPVYTVQDESGTGPRRTLHRSYLRSVGMLGEPPWLSDDDVRLTPTVPKARIGDTPKETGLDGGYVSPLERGQDEGEQGDGRCTVDIFPTAMPTPLRAEAPDFIPRQPVLAPMPHIVGPDVDSQNGKMVELTGKRGNEPEAGAQASREPSIPEREDEIVGGGQSELEEEVRSFESDDNQKEPLVDNTPPEAKQSSNPLRRSTRDRQPVNRLTLSQQVDISTLPEECSPTDMLIHDALESLKIIATVLLN